jgi:hypothetical protein
MANKIIYLSDREVRDEALSEFHAALASALAGSEAQDWQWIGIHMSQRMFGISESRARAYAERHGGIAQKMPA